MPGHTELTDTTQSHLQSRYSSETPLAAARDAIVMRGYAR